MADSTPTISLRLSDLRAADVGEHLVRLLQRAATRVDGDVLTIGERSTPWRACRQTVLLRYQIKGLAPPTDAVGPAAAAAEEVAPQEPRPIAYALWPAWAKAVAATRSAEDLGVGDTIQRTLGAAGAWYEAAMRSLGIPCRCPERRRRWNVEFGYGLVDGSGAAG